MFNTSFLFSSLLWGSIGTGYFVYGKKQQSMSALAGGILMIAASYFSSSALVMWLVCGAIVAGVWFLIKRGF